jgi:putative tryptophan/tyrosine transport system substrate-binding protein
MTNTWRGSSNGAVGVRMALAVCLIACLLATGLLAGCSRPQPSDGGGGVTPPSSTTGSTAAKTFTIGINQFMSHPVLDEVAKGIRDELAAQNVSSAHGDKIIEQNSNGDQSVAVQISKQFVADKVDLIIALGTPAAQSACKETTAIPVVFGAITDPVAAGIAASIERPGGNKTGTSNRWPYEKQVGLIKQIVPGAKKVGVVVNPSESNSQASMNFIRPALSAAGLQLVEVSVASTAEVLNAAKSLVGRCDVFLIPGCNTVIGALDAVAKVAREAKIPLIGGSGDLMEKGSIATYASDHYVLGKKTAQMALEILRDGKDPGSIPVAFADEPVLMVNEAEAAKQGAKIPPDLAAKAKKS